MKEADRAWLALLADRVRLEAARGLRFAGSLGGGVVLVPVPGSAAVPAVHWVGERLASSLQEVGLAAAVWPVLRRRHALRKSAFAAAGRRPSVSEHYASFTVERTLAIERTLRAELPIGPRTPDRWDAKGLRLTLVDDVITRGRTLLAAAARLREAFPGAEIRAFALLRTLGRDEPLRCVLDPCEGEIRWTCGDARRSP